MTVSEFINKVGFKVKDDDVKKVNSTISDIKSTATKLLGAIGIGFSLSAINGLVEEFGNVNKSIKSSVGELENMEEVQNLILDKANESRVSYESMASTVANLTKSSSDLFPIDDAVEFSSTVTKLLKTAGRSDSVIDSIMEGFNKSFQKGIVDTETINKLLEQAPEAANVLAKSLGVSKDKLLDMASSGTMSVTQLKNAFLDASAEIDAAFSETGMTISEALQVIRNKWGLWLAQTDEMLGVTKTLSKAMVSGFNLVIGVLNKLRTATVWLSEKLGGTENLLKMIGIVGGAILVAMKAEKIVAFLKTASTLLGAINLKTLAIIAIIVLIALIIDDFINFMQGNNSVLGEFFKKMGIDAEEVRDTIRNAFTKVKDFLIQVWGVIKQVLAAVWKVIKQIAVEIFGHLQEFWEKHGEKIKELFINTWKLIWDVLKGIWTVLSTVAQAVFGALADFWDKNGESIKETFFFVWDAISETIIAIWETIYGIAKEIFDKIKAYFTENGDSIKQKYTAIWEKLSGYLSSVWNVISSVAKIVFGGIRDFFTENGGLIKDTFVSIWDAIVAFLKPIWDFICNLAMKVFDALKNFWDKWGGTIINLFQSIWNIIAGVFKAVFEVIKGIFDIFAGIFTGDWERVWTGVKSVFQGIWDAIVAVFTNIWNVISDVVSIALGAIQTAITVAWEVVKGVFSTVWNFIANFFKAIWGGICAAVNAAVNAIKTAVQAAWNFISSLFTSIWNGISSFFSGIWNGMKNMVSTVAGGIKTVVSNIFTGISTTVSNIKNTIVNGFQAAINWIKALPSQALQWGRDIISNIAAGIRNAIGQVTSAVSSVASKIKSFLGFSEPDDGPLSNFHTYMPDMIDLMSKGIENGRNKVKEALGDLTGDMSVMASANYVGASTAASAAGGSNVSKSVVQNVNINNEFNGDKAIQQSASKAMDNSAVDITTQLAHGLAYTG